ncbi:Hypothetical predicted protein [Cloeon dipterum]|uniref:Uncharacterized protein n=1 Tax=Cloeon dipterum TaxID=197152 RepID=A0A8S1E2R8_9INSE|nr:Hypothetical predicted protein [Cloeon dipterum]
MSLQKTLCSICERPTADGAISAVHVDKEKLQEWFLNVCGHELAEEIEDEDTICYYCLWHAEFLWKFNQMADELLVWWPRNSDYLDDAAKELRIYYFEGKLEQCWVQLEKIELPQSDDEERRIIPKEKQLATLAVMLASAQSSHIEGGGALLKFALSPPVVRLNLQYKLPEVRAALLPL